MKKRKWKKENEKKGIQKKSLFPLVRAHFALVSYRYEPVETIQNLNAMAKSKVKTQHHFLSFSHYLSYCECKTFSVNLLILTVYGGCDVTHRTILYDWPSSSSNGGDDRPLTEHCIMGNLDSAHCAVVAPPGGQPTYCVPVWIRWCRSI